MPVAHGAAGSELMLPAAKLVMTVLPADADRMLAGAAELTFEV